MRTLTLALLLLGTGCQPTPLEGAWEGSCEISGEADLELSFEIDKDDHGTENTATLSDVEVAFRGNHLDGMGHALANFDAFSDWQITVFYGSDEDEDRGHIYLSMDLDDDDELDGEYSLCGVLGGESTGCDKYQFEGDVTLDRD